MAANPALPLPKGVEADLVLQRLRSDKSLEILHQEALRRLKDNPEFNLHVQELVKRSKAINREGRQRQTKLREEVENRVIEDALKKYLEILNSRDNGMAVTIESHVQAALMEVFVEHYQQESGGGDDGGR